MNKRERKRELRRRLPLHWNRVAFTSEMLEAFAALDRVQIIEDALEEKPGYYYNIDGRPHIVIDSRLRGIERHHVFAHEMAHHWLHWPDAVHCFDGFEKKAETEADIVALCCLIPLPMLIAVGFDELVDEFGWKRAGDRLRLFVTQGI